MFIRLHFHFLRQLGKRLCCNPNTHFVGCSELVDHECQKLSARLDAKHIIRIHHIRFSDQYKPFPDILRNLFVHHLCNLRPLIGERIEYAPIGKIDIAIVPVSLHIQNIAQGQVEHFTLVLYRQDQFYILFIVFYFLTSAKLRKNPAEPNPHKCECTKYPFGCTK